MVTRRVRRSAGIEHSRSYDSYTPSDNHAKAAGSEVKKRVGTGCPRAPGGPKLACTRSTADRPNSATRVTLQWRPNTSRASAVGVAVPVMSTSSGRCRWPFSASTTAIAAAARAPVMRTSCRHSTRTTPRGVRETRKGESGERSAAIRGKHRRSTGVRRWGREARSGRASSPSVGGLGLACSSAVLIPGVRLVTDSPPDGLADAPDHVPSVAHAGVRREQADGDQRRFAGPKVAQLVRVRAQRRAQSTLPLGCGLRPRESWCGDLR